MLWSGVGAGLSGVVRCGSRVKWCGPVWEPDEMLWSGVGAGLSGVVRCGSRVKWCGPVWEPG